MDPKGHRTSKILVRRSLTGRLGLGWQGQTRKTTCPPMHATQGLDFATRKESRPIGDAGGRMIYVRGRREVIGGFGLCMAMRHCSVTMVRSGDCISHGCVLFTEGCVSR